MFGYIAMFLKGECGVISCVFVLFDFNFKYEIKKKRQISNSVERLYL